MKGEKMFRRNFVYQTIVFICLFLVLPTLTYAEEEVAFHNVSVHDPSVIKVENMYYVFGSHLGAAKTKDFLDWELVASGVNENNPLFDNVIEELSEALEWANSDTLWAVDVIELNGKYYMYYNACQGDAPRSALGVAVADDIEGPYTDLGIFLKSGMWDQTSEDGTIYDATTHPNVIDPHTFFDDEGKLWMVYGSYSGGIFILEMDAETGFPIEGQGYGKKLMGGNHSRIEAPYIQYSPETGYYYLYVTFGGLAADGGYNMRVSRSKNPDGPYLDARGQDMIQAKGETGTFFDDTAIDPYGEKLMGNFEFQKSSIADSDQELGYVSPGHNSVYLDEETGTNYLIFHTRFPNKGEAHEVRVHEIVMNEEGWPVVAPIRYSGERSDAITEDEISGEYQIIQHGRETTAEIKKSQIATFNTDQSISDGIEGKWEHGENHQAILTIGDETYTGYYFKQWDPNLKAETITFSAASANGEAIWGIQMPNRSDAEIVEDVKSQLTLGKVTNIIADIALPSEGPSGTTIEWQSSKEEIVSNDGKVTRPALGEEAANVKMTATITKGTTVATKSITLTVLPENEGGLVAYYPFDASFNEKTGNQQAAKVIGGQINQTGGQILFEDGQSGKSAYFDGESGLLLPEGLISGHSYTVSLWVKPEKLTTFTTTFFGATSQENWISLVPSGHEGVNHETLVWSGEQWYDAATGLKIKENEWSHIAFTVDDGNINIYVNGEKTFSGKDFPHVFTTPEAVFSLGVNYWDEPFQGYIDELLVYNELALSEKEIQTYYEKGTIPKLTDDVNTESSQPLTLWIGIAAGILVLASLAIILFRRKKK